MKNSNLLFLLFIAIIFNLNCSNSKQQQKSKNDVTAADLLGNPNYLALSYGGYRQLSRADVPTIEELKEDLKILEAMGVKMLRTYNTQQFAHASNLLKAIEALKVENSKFEMYVMLGAWIDCEDAWTPIPNHDGESLANNTLEIDAAVKMANAYPDIVKIIAVGNEAMVNWAATYYVKPKVILKWVNHLQTLKKTKKLPEDIWITSSDNYESWGGNHKSYHTPDLEALIKAVDYISLHTYPFHDSHYSPTFWTVPAEEEQLSELEQIDAAMLRAKNYAMKQYESTALYVKSLGVEKPIHIGETGWATVSNTQYSETGSRAADEYKEKRFYDHMRDWTNKAGLSCFYFEAFDEQWKDAGNASGPENHFGLFTLKGEAKYALWDMVDKGAFKGLTRGGHPITKTYNGDEKTLMAEVNRPPMLNEMEIREITTINEARKIGEVVTEQAYIVASNRDLAAEANSATYPSEKLKLNAWEGSSNIKMSGKGIIEIATRLGDWWGAAFEMQASGQGENLSKFENGFLHFDIKGITSSSFELGFQTGTFSNGTQTNNFVMFGPGKDYKLTKDWKSYSIKMSELNKNANMEDVTGLFYFKGKTDFDGKPFYVKNISYSKNQNTPF
ncbi:MAG: hypothetical protein ACPGXL_00290 [Chitinophagales bacterium]